MKKPSATISISKVLIVIVLGMVGYSCTAAKPDTASPSLLQITFQYQNSEAQDVRIVPLGDFNGLASQEILFEKSEAGLWQANVQPLHGGFHYFEFLVDQKNAALPGFKTLTAWGKPVHGMEVPFPEDLFYQVQAVPHGKIIEISYTSASTNSQRPIRVYLPHGYDTSGQSYPLLILQHGMNEDETAWSYQGRVAEIMDNLISAKMAVPMIIAMDDGMVDNFAIIILQELLPFLEKQFRLLAGAENRAIAGLSMGAGQILDTYIISPDTFDYLGAFSGYNNNPELVSTIKSKQNSKDRPFVWLAVGEKDFMLGNVSGLSDSFQKNAVIFQVNLSTGAHEWLEWRKYLYHFSQKLFRKDQKLQQLSMPEMLRIRD